MIGGMVSMWGEFVDNANAIDRVWPFSAAVGERLWSSEIQTNITEAADRIQAHQCRLVSRGISAQPPNGPSFCDHEFVSKYSPPFAVDEKLQLSEQSRLQTLRKYLISSKESLEHDRLGP